MSGYRSGMLGYIYNRGACVGLLYNIEFLLYNFQHGPPKGEMMAGKMTFDGKISRQFRRIIMHLETIPLSPKPLFEIMFASIQTKLLIASINLDIFEKLGQKQKSAQEIAEELEGNTVNTTYFLDGLTSLGLLEKNKGHYKNSILSETFLVRGKPTYLGDGFLLQALQKDLSGFDLQELVLKGPVKSTEKLGQSPEKWAGSLKTWRIINAREPLKKLRRSFRIYLNFNRLPKCLI